LKEIVLTNIIENNRPYEDYDLKYQLVYEYDKLKNITEFHVLWNLCHLIQKIDKEYMKIDSIEKEHCWYYEELKDECKEIINSKKKNFKKIVALIHMIRKYTWSISDLKYDEMYNIQNQSKWWHEQALKFHKLAWPDSDGTDWVNINYGIS
jgi:hypothetical protein